MSTWSKDELRKIAESDDLHISPLREDGETYGTPTWIWSVVVGDMLYVRAYNGQKSRWYQAALLQKAGRITAAGMTKEVIFERASDEINNSVDDAYRAKYKGSPYSGPDDWRICSFCDGQGHPTPGELSSPIRLGRTGDKADSVRGEVFETYESTRICFRDGGAGKRCCSRRTSGRASGPCQADDGGARCLG